MSDHEGGSEMERMAAWKAPKIDAPPRAPVDDERPSRPIGGSAEFQQIITDIQRAGKGKELKPSIRQDGGAEIHPDLAGATFNFWFSPSEGGGVGVNMSGDAKQAPWSGQLTGKVFTDVTEAKAWLRQEAKRLAEGK